MSLAFSSAAARLRFFFLHRYNSGSGGKSLAVPILAYFQAPGKLPNVKSSQTATPTRFFRVVLIKSWPDFVFVRAVSESDDVTRDPWAGAAKEALTAGEQCQHRLRRRNFPGSPDPER